MISLKVLSTAAALAVVLPLAAPTAGFAENPKGTKPNFVARGAGGGAPPVARFNGAGAPAMHFGGGGGGGAPVARYNGGGGRGWHGGDGDGDRHRGGGFIPGVVAGAVIGGAIAARPYGYYGGPGYYVAPGYDDGQYYDDGAVAVAPAPVGGDDVAFCMQTYRSYDPASGTYLGYDGLRHPCP